MGSRVGPRLVLPVLGVVLACAFALAFAASASGYTYIVRPNVTTVPGSWTIVPSGSIDSVLDDNVLSPTAPSTAGDYVNENGNGPAAMEVGLQDVALRSGENVTSVRSWGYVSTGDARSLDTELRHGSTVLASGVWPFNTPASWQSLNYTGSLTQAELDDLRQRRTLQGSGASTPVFVYASYAEVHTDMAAATPTITSSPTTPAQGVNPSWSFTSTLAGGFECRLDKGATLISDWAPCTSAKSYDVSGPGDGTYTFSVRGVDDLGGSPGTAATSTYTLDRVGPNAPTIDSGPPAQSNNPMAMWSFTGEGGALHSCRLRRGATVVSNWALCTSPPSYNLGSEADGLYTFEVYSTDMAGNVGGTATGTFTLDRGVPAAPVITSTPPATSNSETPAWSFTHEAGATATCRIQRGATVVSDWAVCTSPKAFDLTSQADGTYTFRVLATDAAGNPSPEATGTYVLDNAAPAAPAITGGPTGSSQNASPSYTFTGEAGAAFECRIARGATVVSDWAPCVSPRSYALALEGDGIYTFRVRATDAALNTGPDASRVYTLDRSAPAAPVIVSGPASESSDPTPTYDFTSEPGSTNECRMERAGTVVSDWTACSTPHTADVTAQLDGAFTFRVRSTDGAGNPGPEASSAYTLDRSAPAPPTITGGPSGDTNNTTANFTFTAGGGETTQCRMERGATVVSDWAACTSPRAYDLSGEVDGTYTFRVRALDGATNVGGDSSRSFALDRVAPAVPVITAAPPASGNGETPTWSFTHDAGTSAQCRIARGATVVSDWAACASPRSYNLASEPDGLYTFRVRAVDAAGNTGADVSGTYALDHSPPPAPTITAGPTGASTDQSPSYAFTYEAGAQAQCRMTRGATVVQDWTNCNGSRNYNLNGQPDGTYTFHVRATDPAGNTGAEATRSYDLDRAAPAAPVITGGPPPSSADAAPSFSFTQETGATASCRLVRGATVISDWAACSSPKGYDISAQPDGTYTFGVRSTDAAGNLGAEASRSYVLDRVEPVAPTITGRPAAVTNDGTPTWDFTASFDVTRYRCHLDRGATVVFNYTTCTSPHTYDLSALPDGTYTFGVRGSDEAANESTETQDTFTLDRAAPPAPTVTGGPTGSSSNAMPSYTFTAEAGASTQCRIERGATVVSDWAACVSPRSYDLTLQPDGAYTFRVRATDAAGNTGADGTRTYTLDRTAPAAPVITGYPPGYSADPTPAVSFTYEPGATASCRLERGATVVSDWAPCSSPHTHNLTSEPDGTYTFRVRATDAAGNTSTESGGTYVLDRVAPSAPSIGTRPAALTNDTTPTWSYTGDADTVSFECRITDGFAAVVSDWAACTSPKTYDITAEPDDTYTFAVRAVDGGGLRSAATTDAFALDRQPPPAPTMTGGPSGDSQNAMPSYSYTMEAGASSACRVERGATLVSDWAPCVSPRSYDFTLQPDGVYTFLVRATDVAGNTGPQASRVYTLDRTAPAAPVVTSGPPADSNDDTPVYSFTGEIGGTFACRLERGATAISDWAPCSTPQGYDIGSEVDGTYTFRVRVTDAAGNTSAAATRAYALDRQAPAAPVLTATPGADTNDATPTWAYTAAAGTTQACRIERGATVISDWAACASPRTYDLSAQPDGSYTFRVRATDAAGNTGNETADTIALDRVNPAVPTITGGPPATSADPTPAYDFTHEAGATASCRIERGAAVVSDWTACSSPRSYDLTAQVDGSYTFRVRATDPAGNTGGEATRAFTLDRVAPNQPSIGTRPAAATNDETPTFGWTSEPGATDSCRVTRGATVVVGWATCTSPRTFDLSSEPDGTYTFHVRSSDPAANVSTEATDTFALDRNPPAAPTVTTRPPDDTNDQTPTWGWSAGADAVSFRCRVERGAAVISDWAACTDPSTFDLTGEPDGSYTFRVRATDAAGNEGGDGNDAFTLDRMNPPAPAITAGPTGDEQDATPTFAWTAEPGASSECRIERGATVVDDWSACTSAATFNLGGEADGVYTFLVRATDQAGNTGGSSSRSYTLDRTAPAAPAVVSGPAADSTDDSPTFGFTAEAGAALECRLERGATVVDAWGPCTSPKIYDVSGEPDGTYTFGVRATDAAGNTGVPGTRSYTLDRTTPAAPVLDARPGDDGNDRTPEWAFSTPEPNRTFECRLARGATVIGDWGPCVSPRQWDLTLEIDGPYTFGVRAVNMAGTRSPATTDLYRLDTAAPAAPGISGGPAADSSDDTPSWTISPEPGATLECRLERGATTISDWAPCSTPQGYDLTAEPDGTYTFLTRATDAAGNTGAAGSSSYALDRTVPLEPVVGANPPANGSDPTPTIEFSGEPGMTFECRVTRDGGTVVEAWAVCTSPYTPDLNGHPDGDYTIEIVAINAAGTRSPAISDDYALDRQTPAAPVITNGPAADSPDDTPTFTFTGESAATFECRVERGGSPVIDWAACTSPDTPDLNAEPDGTYTFRVRQADPAGNVSPDATRSYNLDRTIPAAPVFDTRPASPGFDQSPEWTLTTTPGLTMECRLTRGSTVVSDWTDCTSPRTYDLSSEPDGTYTLHARQYNLAGTRGPEVTDAYELDVTAPLAPDITASPGPAGNGSSPAWTFAAETGAALECRLERGTVDVRPWAPCTSPRTFGLAGEPDGDYTFSVRATDAAGNTGAVASSEHTLDRVPPAPPTIGDNPGPLGPGRTPAWSFTAEAGAAFECTLAGAAGAVDEWAVCASPRGYDLGGRPDGAYAFGVRARDAAGNTGPAASYQYVLDTTPGAVRIEGGPGPLGRDRRPAWRFAGEESASFECRLSLREVPVADWGPCVSPQGFDLDGRPDGTFAFSLRATDPAGNVGPTGDASYVLDTTPPSAPSIDSRPETPGEDDTPTWRFSGEDDATYSCRVEAVPAATVLDWTLCASPFTADLATADDGDYRFLVRATDLAGNTGEPSSGRYELVAPRKDDEKGDEKGETGDVPEEDDEGGAPLTTTPKPRRPRETAPAAPEKTREREAKPKDEPAPSRRPEPRSPAPAPEPSEDDNDDDEGGNFATRAVSDAVKAIAQNPDKSVFPLSLLLLVLGFLAIQNRIDRSDPKLALAPTFADPDLEFRPPPGDDQ